MQCNYDTVVDRGLDMWPGAQDFLPDYEQVPHWHSVYSVYPRYSPLFTAMRKAKEWMHNARVSVRTIELRSNPRFALTALAACNCCGRGRVLQRRSLVGQADTASLEDLTCSLPSL